MGAEILRRMSGAGISPASVALEHGRVFNAKITKAQRTQRFCSVIWCPRAGEGRAPSRPPFDGRMAGCPVVPMVDDPMTAPCKGNARCILPWGRGRLARGGRAGARPSRHWEVRLPAAHHGPKCVSLQVCKCPVSSIQHPVPMPVQVSPSIVTETGN